MVDLYSIESEINDFKNLTTERQEEILEIVKDLPLQWRFGVEIETLLPVLLGDLKIYKDKALELFELYATVSKDYRWYGGRRVPFLINTIKQHDSTWIRIFLGRKDIKADFQKHILTFESLSIDEEEFGLRALSKSKICPGAIIEAKYQPTIDALKKLPPVMRLDCMETLCGQRFNSYNVFGNIKDSDEFRSLLFTVALKYRDRAELLWKKYCEISDLGKPGSVVLSGICPKCGPFELVINSMVLKTKEGLKNSRLSYLLADWCPLCSTHLRNEMMITEKDWT